MDILVILVVLLIIICVYVAMTGSDATHLLLAIVASWLALCEMFRRQSADVEKFDQIVPDRLQDIYYFETVPNDVKQRNKDAFPYETDGSGPILGPYWAVDNSDVVADTLDYSRGVYGADPVKKRIGTYNAESFDNDDGLAKRQEYRASMNKRAMEGASRSTRNIFDKHFTAELAETESQEWWGGERMPENDYRSY